MKIRENLTQHIAALPDHLVKDVLLRWVETSDFSPVALDKALTEQQQSLETQSTGSDQSSKPDDDLNFVLPAEEQAQSALEQGLEDAEYVTYLNTELATGLEQLNQGKYGTRTLEEIEAAVLIKHGHKSASEETNA